MKGEFFRPCPKCGKICNAELDMCEICSGKIVKPELPKPIIPVVTPVVEPIVEEVAPIVEEQVATEEVIEEVATEENIVEETINKEKQEEVVVPVIETKAPKGKGAKGLYALVAVLMLVIVALVVVIMQDRQPTVAVGNTTLPSNTTSTTSAQETETTTEITEGTTTENAGETLAPVTTTKKAQNTNKETTTKKGQVDVLDEDITNEANKVEFNPEIVYSKNKVYRHYEMGYAYDYKISTVYISTEETDLWGINGAAQMFVEFEILAVYECAIDEYGDPTDEIIKEVEMPEKLPIKDSVLFYTYAYYYTKNNEKYDWNNCPYSVSRNDCRTGYKETGEYNFSVEDIYNISKIVVTGEPNITWH